MFGARVDPGRGRSAGREADDFGSTERRHQNKQAQKVRELPRSILAGRPASRGGGGGVLNPCLGIGVLLRV